MRNIFIINFVILSVLLETFQLNAQDLTQAVSLIEEERFDEASKVLNTLISQNLEISEVSFFLGTIELKKENYADAAKNFQRGIESDPRYASNYSGMGYLQLKDGNEAKASEYFEKATSLAKSKNTWALTLIADAYLSINNDPDKAIVLLERAAEMDNASSYTFIVMGEAWYNKNQGGKAADNFEKALVKNPRISKAHLRLGQIFITTNEELSTDHFKKALELNSDCAAAYKELGDIYFSKKEYKTAIDYYKKYLEVVGTNVPEAIRYANLLVMVKDYTNAIDFINKLIEAAESNYQLYRLRAYASMESGNPEAGVKDMEKYFENTTPDKISASDHEYYGKLLLKTGKDSSGIVELNKSLAKDSSQVEIRQLLADALLKTKRYPEAIKEYALLKEVKNKNSHQNWFNLGKTYFLNKEYVQADSVLNMFLEVQKEYMPAYLYKARSLAHLDQESDKGLAKADYEKVVEKVEENSQKYKAELIEAYSYLGYYYFLKQEYVLSKGFWEKIKSVDPSNAIANEALSKMNKTISRK